MSNQACYGFIAWTDVTIARVSNALHILNTAQTLCQTGILWQIRITTLARILHLVSGVLFPHLHLHNGSAHRGHGSLDVHVVALKYEPVAFGLLPHKALLVVVIHLVVQTLVAVFALLVDSHCQPVLVQLIVKWHREHYSYYLFGAVALYLKQVVGQDTHCAGGFAAVLGEVAQFSF